MEAPHHTSFEGPDWPKLAAITPIARHWARGSWCGAVPWSGSDKESDTDTHNQSAAFASALFPSFMSRFVSGGTVDEPVERDEAWLNAQQDIDARRRQKEDEARQEGGKTLYETLQANKAAKQEAFEEAARLKNQFRSLDQDEIEFLDSVLESTRAKESAVKKETAEQLELFRRQQEESEKVALDAEPDAHPVGSDAWIVSTRKRKRARERDVLPGVKLRKSSSAADQKLDSDKANEAVHEERSAPAPTPKDAPAPLPVQPSPLAVAKAIETAKQNASPPTTASPKPPASVPAVAPAALGLGAYSSDDD